MNANSISAPNIRRNPNCNLNVILDEIEKPSFDQQLIETLVSCGDDRPWVIADRAMRRAS